MGSGTSQVVCPVWLEHLKRVFRLPRLLIRLMEGGARQASISILYHIPLRTRFMSPNEYKTVHSCAGWERDSLGDQMLLRIFFVLLLFLKSENLLPLILLTKPPLQPVLSPRPLMLLPAMLWTFVVIEFRSFSQLRLFEASLR